MAYGLITFQGVRYALFAFSEPAGAGGGHADFDWIEVAETPRRSIPLGRRVMLELPDGSARLEAGGEQAFTIVGRGLGRVALQGKRGFLSVQAGRAAELRPGAPGPAETFQWMETFTGEVILMSLATHRYIRLDSAGGGAFADSPGPRPDGRDGVRFLVRYP